jgi:hypothetical protein
MFSKHKVNKKTSNKNITGEIPCFLTKNTFLFDSWIKKGNQNRNQKIFGIKC